MTHIDNARKSHKGLFRNLCIHSYAIKISNLVIKYSEQSLGIQIKSNSKLASNK